MKTGVILGNFPGILIHQRAYFYSIGQSLK